MHRLETESNLVEIRLPKAFSALYNRLEIQSRKCVRKANLNVINLTAVLRHKSFSQLLQLVY